MTDAERIAEIRERWTGREASCQNVPGSMVAEAIQDAGWLWAKVEDLQTILKEFAFLDGITPDGIVDVEQFCVRLRALAAKAAEETTDA